MPCAALAATGLASSGLTPVDLPAGGLAAPEAGAALAAELCFAGSVGGEDLAAGCVAASATGAAEPVAEAVGFAGVSTPEAGGACFAVAFFATGSLLVATAVAAARAGIGLVAFFTSAGTDFAWARAAGFATGFVAGAFRWALSLGAFAAVPDAFMPDTSYPSSAG